MVTIAGLVRAHASATTSSVDAAEPAAVAAEEPASDPHAVIIDPTVATTIGTSVHDRGNDLGNDLELTEVQSLDRPPWFPAEARREPIGKYERPITRR